MSKDFEAKYQGIIQYLKNVTSNDFNNKYIALGYTSNLDILCNFDIDKINSLIIKCRPNLKVEKIQAAKEIHTLEDLLTTILFYCLNGIGGEVDICNTDIIYKYFDCSYGMGGTAVQAALALSKIGKKSIVHLTDDSKEVCEQLISPNIYIVDKQLNLQHTEHNQSKNDREIHFILQFKKGDKIYLGKKSYTIPDSNRLILTHSGINGMMPLWNPYFEWIEKNAKIVSSNVVSSFNCILDLKILKKRLDFICEHLKKYHEKNPRGIVFYEDAHYHDLEIRKETIRRLFPIIDIVSMNEEEFEFILKELLKKKICIDNIFDCVKGAQSILKEYKIKKGIIVHSKHYAMYVGDKIQADIESGLMCGNILATAKALYGYYGTYDTIYEVLNLQLSEKGLADRKLIEETNTENVIIVPTRYIEKPNYTIGLGDSFVGGVQLCF